MKTNVEPHNVLFKEIDAGITHSKREGLPLKSIELDAQEWELFCWAFEHCKRPPSQLLTSVAALRKYEETRYKNTKIYKEKT